MNSQIGLFHSFHRVIFHRLMLFRQTSAILRSRFFYQDSCQGFVQQASMPQYQNKAISGRSGD